VQLVGGLLDVGDGEHHGVALLHLDAGGRDGGTNHNRLHGHLIPLPHRAGVLHIPDRQRVLVLRLGVDLDRVELVGLDHLSVVRLGLGEGVVEKLHFLLGDVHQLRGLRLRGTHREMAAMGKLV